MYKPFKIFDETTIRNKLKCYFSTNSDIITHFSQSKVNFSELTV
jgi:hypothetical protein